MKGGPAKGKACCGESRMLNRIVLMGRLTKAPELKYTPSNVAVVSFTLAVDRDYTSNGTRETDFIDCVAWRSTAEFVSRYFTKGQQAAVSGRLQIRQWQDKEGNNRRSAEVVVDNVYFSGEKKEKMAVNIYPDEGEFVDLDDDSDLPF